MNLMHEAFKHVGPFYNLQLFYFHVYGIYYLEILKQIETTHNIFILNLENIFEDSNETNYFTNIYQRETGNHYYRYFKKL